MTDTYKSITVLVICYKQQEVIKRALDSVLCQKEYGLNKIEVILGNGWYKGRFGFHGGESEIFGDKFALLCDIVVEFEDGSTTIITSDETWKCKESKIKFSGIYDGEVLEWYRNYYSTNMGGGENSNDFLYNKKSNKGIGINGKIKKE